MTVMRALLFIPLALGVIQRLLHRKSMLEEILNVLVHLMS